MPIEELMKLYEGAFDEGSEEETKQDEHHDASSSSDGNKPFKELLSPFVVEKRGLLPSTYRTKTSQSHTLSVLMFCSSAEVGDILACCCC